MNTNKDFFERVYECVRLIPYGRVTSYGSIAKYIGAPKSARMVGIALNHSHKSQEYVPAHRVVNRNGILTGKHHFMNINTMEELLKSEGILIKNDKVINFQKVFWDACKNE